ncbi:MAG: IPTL-CTERM sorting domain-containing protein, partial [Gammaproteobacteria bacterium]
VIPLAAIPLPNLVPNADGEIHLQFVESFDDVPDAIDANHTNNAAPAVCGGLYFECTDQAACDAAVGGADPAADEARFAVSKDFDDNNEGSVEVTLSCNTGLPLEQTTTIEEGDGVNFVIGDFEQGELNCEITETPVDGYTTSYDNGIEEGGASAVSCAYADLIGAQYTCLIENDLDQVVVEVTKEWVDENPGFNPFNVADADWDCSNVAFGADSGGLDFYTEGSSDTDSFSVYPDWDTGTTCWISEVNLPDGGVEVDDSNCQGLTLFPGGGASCTIVNTRLYEGIPTLSQYGLAVLALLMLGMGFVGFRRFV